MKFRKLINEAEEQSVIDKPTIPVPEDLIGDLFFFIKNDAELYRIKYKNIITDLVKKKRRGTYRPELAQKEFHENIVIPGAKKYTSENKLNKKWDVIFTPGIRNATAKEFVTQFESDYELGNYDTIETIPEGKNKDMKESKEENFKLSSLLTHDREILNESKVLNSNDKTISNFSSFKKLVSMHENENDIALKTTKSDDIKNKNKKI